MVSIFLSKFPLRHFHPSPSFLFSRFPPQGRAVLSSSTAHSKRNLQHSSHNVIEISIVQDTPKEALVRATHRSLSRTTWANDTSLIKPGTINGGRGLNYPNKRFQVGWCGFFGEEKPTWRFLNWKFVCRNRIYGCISLRMESHRSY